MGRRLTTLAPSRSGMMAGMSSEEQVLAEAADLGITEDELEREAEALNRPGGWLPGVGPVSGLVMDMLAGFTGFRDRIPRASKCYRMASGAMVHVKPECRC